MYGGTTREDPEYPGTLSIPDTVYGGTTREDPEYPGILSMGGQLGRIPSILSILDPEYT